MVFSSTTFLLAFLPLVAILYYICPRKLRNGLLLVFSLLFYGWGEPKYILIMLFSTVFDYCNGLAIGHFRSRGRAGGAKAVLVISVVGNLAILGFFKYTDFAISNLNGLLGTAIPALGLLLPIGISFYTFQTMSYTIDVYRGLVPPQRNIVDFGAYVTLFPQLIAGPIVQYKTVAYDLEHRRESVSEASEGLQRLVIGLGKKVLIANQMGAIWEDIAAMSDPTAVTAWIGAIAYTFQIYFDFSGYSDMAIGLGHFFGFHFLENFNYPYESRSVTEFWRRWHISLSTWFREYVYIPLGGSRNGVPVLILATMVTFVASGAWHGATAGFLVWGALHGIYLLIGRATKKARSRFWGALHQSENSPLRSVAGCLFTFLLVNIGWFFFMTGTLHQAQLVAQYLFQPIPFSLQYLKESFTQLGYTTTTMLRLGLFALLAAGIDWLSRKEGFGAWAARQKPVLLVVLCYLCVFASLFFGAAGTLQNVYFAF